MADDFEPRKFLPLGQYTPPTTPADETVRTLLKRMLRLGRRAPEDPFLSGDSLRLANRRRLDRIVPPPACGPLIDDLQVTLAQWTVDPTPVHWMQLIVLPPCDHGDLIGTWAARNGHTVLSPPRRGDIVSNAVPLPDFSGDGVIVIPRLEQWFVRHRDGLDLLRRMLDRLSMLRRHCVIGCNSWAWNFLSRGVGADLVLPRGVTLQAFDACRLHHWFSQLIETGEADGKVFRLSHDGQNIFHDPGETGNTQSDYLKRLAAKSLGIPWIAWSIWRSSLRLAPLDNERVRQRFPDEEALWIAEPQEMKLPTDHESAALFALHALLLHHALTAEELGIVLPSLDESHLLTALVSSDFVERDGDRFHCAAAAYPSIRQALSAAGFPLDRM